MSDESEDAIEDPLIGQTIQERFRVERKLGQGGMGAIYLAEHLLLQKKVALKCLHAGLASNPEVVRRFKNEAVAATSIGHPNIVAVMDMGRFEDGTFFMVLEYLDGRDWQDDLDKSGIQPVAKVAHVGMQVCAALEAASAKGIVHRDLKPENIFLVDKMGDENFVKVLDFGISKILHGGGGATKTGQLMGTPYYMAPEQVLGEKDITHLADIYALGVIFFQALSGTVPFEGETLAQIIMKIATQPNPSLAERSSGVPAEFVALVAQMMEKEPSARPQSFQEVATRLSAFVDDASAVPVAVAASTSPAVRSRTVLAAASPSDNQEDGGKRVPIWMIGAGAAVVGFGVVLAKGGDDEETAAVDAVQEVSTEEQPVVEDEEPDPNKVRVQISTVPEDAELILDGKKIENPFDEELERDSKNHELVVKRDGYETETRKMVLTAAQTIVIPLSAIKEEPAPTKGSKTQSSGTSSSKSSGSRSSGASNSGSRKKKKAPKPLRDLERGFKKLF